MAGKKPKGRPARPMPPKIDASPEEIAEVVLQVSHKEVVALILTNDGMPFNPYRGARFRASMLKLS